MENLKSLAEPYIAKAIWIAFAVALVVVVVVWWRWF